MILIDTSVWIDFFHNHAQKEHVIKLKKAINYQNVIICDIILMEILQGIRDEKQHKLTKDYLMCLPCLEITQATYLSAAQIYRELRTHGITIRKSIDCIIAAVALQHQCDFLHNDYDFEAKNDCSCRGNPLWLPLGFLQYLRQPQGIAPTSTLPHGLT